VLYLAVRSLAGALSLSGKGHLVKTYISFLRGFSVPSFAKLIAAKNNSPVEKTTRLLWGENYFDPDVSITFRANTLLPLN